MRAEDTAEALRAIAAGGPLTPSRVLKHASSPHSILHARFEWDDSKAAHQYRLAQARALIRAYVIKPEGATRELHAFINIRPSNGEGEYHPIQAVVSHPTRLAIARDQALRDLAAAEANVAEIEEAVRLFGADKEERLPKTRRVRALFAEAKEVLASV